MENLSNTNIKETLLLTSFVFNMLLNKVVEHFKKEHRIGNSYKDSQLYGFGNYNPKLPNLKNDLELVLRGYINGKYLYNKYREVTTGKPVIKISREYKYIFFKYLGYKDVSEFIEEDFIPKNQKKLQNDLLNQLSVSKDFYYVCYYYGENNQMNKGQFIIYNNWRNVEMKYIYHDESGSQNIYTFFGVIESTENFIHFKTNYYIGNKKTPGANYTFFTGISSPGERHYLIGTYSGFDKYSRAIAGKMILKKYTLKAEIEEEASGREFDPIICQELNKQRLVIESNIRKNPLLFSKKSPYAQVLFRTVGTFTSKFIIADNFYELKFEIRKYHYNIVSLTDSIIIEDDYLSVINKGQVLMLDFSITGMFYLQKVTIYIKALDFLKDNTIAQGSYNGVDINNNIVSGMVAIKVL